MSSTGAAPQSNLKGFLLSLTAAVMWGMLPVALKEVLSGMDATTIVWYRFLIAGVVLWVWLAATCVSVNNHKMVFASRLGQPLRKLFFLLLQP